MCSSPLTPPPTPLPPPDVASVTLLQFPLLLVLDLSSAFVAEGSKTTHPGCRNCSYQTLREEVRRFANLATVGVEVGVRRASCPLPGDSTSLRPAYKHRPDQGCVRFPVLLFISWLEIDDEA